ncbi:hypothetical protein B0H14DRAFT_3433275 [Mycena olivaceomarginata]|nr:hypothetical protein B0H14DRAFT_3433275 [Mycena olivaceomarginata]
MTSPKGKSDATHNTPSASTLTPSSSSDTIADTSDTSHSDPHALIASIRQIITVARGQKKHPTADGYAKIFANLTLLSAILDTKDYLATTLASFKADLVAELVATNARSPASSSYASAINSTRPPAPAPPKPSPAAKSNEFVVSFVKANDVLVLPVPEIKAKVEAAIVATGAEKLKETRGRRRPR